MNVPFVPTGLTFPALALPGTTVCVYVVLVIGLG